MIRAFAAFLVLMLATPVKAQDFIPITDRGNFIDLVNGKQLRLATYGITLNVLPDGRISGRGFGQDVTGSWNWQDGYFCREMLLGSRTIEYNCQLVEARGADRMRFTVDRGAGQSATFRVQ